MVIAVFWDNKHPGLASSSIQAEKAYRYFDPHKVDAVLSQLEKEFIKNLTENSKSKNSNDPTSYISKVINSGLVNRLMQANSSKAGKPVNTG